MTTAEWAGRRDAATAGADVIAKMEVSLPVVRPDGSFAMQQRPLRPEDQLRRLRLGNPLWAFMYDPRAQLFHAVLGRRHFVASDPAGPWHRVGDVAL